MRFAQAGFQAVSTFGWTVSHEQVEIMSQLAKGVIWLPDADKQKETQAFCGLLARNVWVRMPDYQASDTEALTDAPHTSPAPLHIVVSPTS